MKPPAKDIEILYVDNHLLAVNKPAGLLTQPNGSGHPDLETRAQAWVKKTYGKPGNVFLHPIHRLDKPVSGIVLFARTSKALSRLNEQMRSRTLIKIYHAEVERRPIPAEGELRTPLTHGNHCALVQEGPNSKEAHLSYRTLETKPATTLLEVTLHTGRYHQIRAQLAHIGHPICGDTKYGAQPTSKPLALTHTTLKLLHPTKNIPLQLRLY